MTGTGYAVDPALPIGIPAGPGTAVTVGTFDGVHRGHWSVLQRLRDAADQRNLSAVLATFHPHPLKVVRPTQAPQLLTTPEEKKEILAESGLDYVVFLPFSRTLQGYEPRRFVQEILMGRLRMRHLVIGYDHGFGKGRSGDVDTVRGIGRELGFGVDVVEAKEAGGDPISSSKIRRAVVEGRVMDAARGLGRPYSLRGPVIRGEGRGRELGFPTANIRVPDPEKLLPREGIYAVTAMLRGGPRRGLLHLGPRPTFQGLPPSVELHLLDFDGDLYGQEVRVDFCAWLREIRAFDGVEGLVRAMEEDRDRALARFAQGATACG